jgi:hypothetical protein
LFIFTKNHCSMMYVPSDRPRALFKAEEPTNADKIPAFDSFLANSGTYEVSCSTLTIRPIVARYPNFMAGGLDQVPISNRREDLSLTEKSTDQTSRIGNRVVSSTAPAAETRMKLVRVE